MIGIALFFWSPHAFIRKVGWIGLLAWAIAIGCIVDRDRGMYLLKLRIFGVEGILSLGTGGPEGQNGGNIPFSEENADQWHAFLAGNGVKIAIPDSPVINLTEKTVILPTEMGEIRLEIGDKIALGSPAKYVIVQIGGYRQQEDGNTKYFFTHQ